jgi:hypothetical protein
VTPAGSVVCISVALKRAALCVVECSHSLMAIVGCICLRFYIEVGVGVGTFLPAPTPPKIPSDFDSVSTVLVCSKNCRINYSQ